MREATIEVLNVGEIVMGAPTSGRFFVREYEDGEERGGSFFETLEEADNHVADYISKDEEDSDFLTALVNKAKSLTNKPEDF